MFLDFGCVALFMLWLTWVCFEPGSCLLCLFLLDSCCFCWLLVLVFPGGCCCVWTLHSNNSSFPRSGGWKDCAPCTLFKKFFWNPSKPAMFSYSWFGFKRKSLRIPVLMVFLLDFYKAFLGYSHNVSTNKLALCQEMHCPPLWSNLGNSGVQFMNGHVANLLVVDLCFRCA